MKYKNIGKTGLKVSTVCLGTMTYGVQIGETESINLIKSALDAGINFLDVPPEKGRLSSSLHYPEGQGHLLP
jgi:aryl-alcohol dehydrogenase-like predicted oxidoreductase